MIQEKALPALCLFGEVLLIDLLVFFCQRSLLSLPIRLGGIEPQSLAWHTGGDGLPLAFPVGVFLFLSLADTCSRQHGGQCEQRNRASIQHVYPPSVVGSL